MGDQVSSIGYVSRAVFAAKRIASFVVLYVRERERHPVALLGQATYPLSLALVAC